VSARIKDPGRGVEAPSQEGEAQPELEDRKDRQRGPKLNAEALARRLLVRQQEDETSSEEKVEVRALRYPSTHAVS
jgi:hypothetical protein